MSMRNYEGLPVHARLGVGSTKLPGPHGLHISFGDSIRLALPAVRGARSASSCDVLSRVRSVVGLLSWGCQRSAPPSTWVPGVHSQWFRCSGELSVCFVPKDSASRRGATFDPVLPNPGFVPPLSFLPTSTVCSTWHFAGLLHPAADHGVRHVSGPSSRSVSPDLSFRRGGGRGLGSPALVVRSRGCVPSASSLRPCRRARASPEGRTRSSDEAHRRFSWTFPNGAPPFGAFPSSAAVPRQPCLRAAFQIFRPGRCDPVGVSRLERWSAFRPGPPRSLPSRRCFRGRPPRLVPLLARGASTGWRLPVARPQGFRPLTNPLRPPSLATWCPPDAPLGFAH